MKDVLQRLFAGERSALARAITMVESRSARWQNEGQSMVAAALQRPPPSQACSSGAGPRSSFRIGLTGPPGAGKSTFVEALGTMLTARQEKVAVLSIDPSSALSGGSILGDKTRMTHLSRDPLAYVRPSPSSGTLGGVARNTCDSIVLCEAAGFNTILVETVGVGQSETAVADMVDMFILVMPPGAGDELQGIKRGIVELSDMVIVNKADGDLIPAARRAHYEYRSALKLMKQRSAIWSPRVISVSSLEQTGIDKAWSNMLEFHAAMTGSGELHSKRMRQANIWMWHHVTDRIMAKFRAHPDIVAQLPELEREVSEGRLTAGQGADTLLAIMGLHDTDPILPLP